MIKRQGKDTIGVQLVARPWCDEVALAAAALIERELGGWQAPDLGWLDSRPNPDVDSSR